MRPCADISLRNLCIFIATLVVMSNSVRVLAQESNGSAPEARWYEMIKANVFASASYSYNANLPDSRSNQLRIFDTDDNSLKMDVVELALQKTATQAGDIGFCFHLTAGSSIPKVIHSSGLNSGDLDFHQLYLRYVARVGNGLTMDFGKFITPFGYELIEGYDGYNDNVTRSFLFGFAVPATHTGVRLSYAFSDVVSATALLVNGWDNSIDNNRPKSFGGQIALTPLSGLTVLANYLTGSERANCSNDPRTVVDLCATYVCTEHFTMGINGDYGAERGAATDGRTAKWNGAAAYFRFNATSEFSLTFRAEHFEDHDGARTGGSRRLHEFTLTPEYRPANGIVFRGDLRLDTSSDKVFEKRGDFTDTQFTICANVLFVL